MNAEEIKVESTMDLANERTVANDLLFNAIERYNNFLVLSDLEDDNNETVRRIIFANLPIFIKLLSSFECMAIMDKSL